MPINGRRAARGRPLAGVPTTALAVVGRGDGRGARRLPAVDGVFFVAAGAADTACGTKKLRHNAASKMLKTGSALPVIAASIGHVSPDTPTISLTTDDERLKECILPLPLQV